jgi:hypothetical protein
MTKQLKENSANMDKALAEAKAVKDTFEADVRKAMEPNLKELNALIKKNYDD